MFIFHKARNSVFVTNLSLHYSCLNFFLVFASWIKWSQLQLIRTSSIKKYLSFNWNLSLNIRTRVNWWVSGLAYFWCCQLQSDISIGKFVIFRPNAAQHVLTFDRHLCCLQWLGKIILSKNKYHFSRGLSRTMMNLHFCMTIKHHPIV